jgi:glucokinase
MFCGFLGSVAGDLALTLGARGGIYIGGSGEGDLGELLLVSGIDGVEVFAAFGSDKLTVDEKIVARL